MKVNLVVCITFFYKIERLKYLKESIESILEFNCDYEIIIATNTFDKYELSVINDIIDQKLNILSFKNGHPYLLAWSHFVIFADKIKELKYTHFLYLEDDLKFTQINFNYWIEARSMLKDLNGYPAFFRYEKNNSFKQYSTDVPEPMSIYDCKVIETSGGDYFINIVYPYQGMYLYDRELMLEYFNSPSFNPDFDHGIFNSLFASKPFNIREKAALGLTYLNIPKGFRSRAFLPYNQKENILESECLIHHIPNNYTQDNSSPYGKIEINGIFKKKTTNLFLNYTIKLFLKTILRQILKK
jgi:hypothetical protein